ncbi:cbb3-type cytochrome c oxidase subunit I [Leptospira levettii]|uniref:cbb3-type cytochrome c oxidase subunit I n=1 Tax=Leptospira levettii TaxID=2023178 RepID=UPI001EEA40E3|nr:cbb3-type cytochrome c oxidase subunit I [Leptospira levettii]MCG6147635.1 cbb3-type cytochrome c oxidase subunit I [Leptospira levettii]
MFPIQSVWLLRSSLVYFLFGTLLGALLMTQKIFLWDHSLWFFLPIHYSIMVWGFFIQFIMGTAYWMFPKHLSDLPRGSHFQAWFLFYSYNVGLVSFILIQLNQLPNDFERFAKILICLAIVMFIRLMWVRSISYNS